MRRKAGWLVKRLNDSSAISNGKERIEAMDGSPWAQPAQQNELGAPLMPTNELGDALPVQEPTPQVFAPAPTTPGQDQISNDQQQLQKVRWQQANPWGTPDNHPGKLGKTAHVFSTLGNIAGDIFAPDVMAHIPGTQMNREVKEGELAKRLNTEITDESQNQERGATTAKTTEETAEMPGKTQSEEGLQGAQKGNLESETRDRDAAAGNPSLIIGHAHAVNQAIKEGRDPATDPIVQQYEKAITSTVPGFNKPAEAPKTIQIEKEGKPHQMAWDAKTNSYDLDQGESGEKPPTGSRR